jgi:hypothetical protein
MKSALTRRQFVASSALAANVQAPGFASRWRGKRIWIGPEYWANPLQDWRVDGGAVAAKPGENRTLHILTHQAEPGTLAMSVRVTAPREAGRDTSAGFRIGVQGQLDDYRHVLVSPVTWVDAAVRGDGKLVLDGSESTEAVSLARPVTLELRMESGTVELRAAGVSVKKSIPESRLRGNIALLANAAPKAMPAGEWRFADWKGSGTALREKPDQTFGPILWTQYTLSKGVMKMTALFPPLGDGDAKTARFEVQRGGKWTSLSDQPIDPMSRTATFRIADWNAADTPYRVVYRWQGKAHEWSGTIRREPNGGTLKVGVFSCDNGYVFPLPRMVANVKVHDPDLLYFAGDQIYEGYGGFGLAREPADLAMLDYLRKFWQFGWTWRELLRDRPAVVIPDDHDMFQGNIWGQGGRKIPKGRERGFTYGGYVEPPEWVNAVQRTQSAHLPEPVDPEPIEQGITVYFTELFYGGVSFAIVEDRKFKTGPESIFPNGVPQPKDPQQLDAAGAELLGKRQEDFLRRWAARRDGALRVVLSQTIFCKVTTHASGDLHRSTRDLDCGGWPQSGRRRALEALPRNTLMIHGDQHIGALVRHGIDQWEDGPLAFMVPGTANGFPRAWWPDEEKPDGRYIDDLGNRMTVLGIANPDKGSNKLPRAKTNPEELAHRKGSGYGIVRLDTKARIATFEMWRYLFDAAKPKREDQFPGFPQVQKLG